MADAEEEKVVAVIIVGGPTKGTRFRPLSFNTPKPLFPLAGQPMIHHPITACNRIPNLARIFLIGFYDEKEFMLYALSLSNELKIPVRYLREDKPHGSAGGLYYFKDVIMEDSPSHIFLLNCDVCCNFPLSEMLDADKRYGGIGTLLVVKAILRWFLMRQRTSSVRWLLIQSQMSCCITQKNLIPLKVSDLINCGVYIFTPYIFYAIEDVACYREDGASLRRLSSYDRLISLSSVISLALALKGSSLKLEVNTSQCKSMNNPAKDFERLDQDILTPLAGKKRLYAYETMDFWEQIKTPGVSLKCSALYLGQYRSTSSHLLASGDGIGSAKIIGPDVSISANVCVGFGVRLVNCIILDDVILQENALVMNAIIGWKSSLGQWSRVQADGDYNTRLGITILRRIRDGGRRSGGDQQHRPAE